MPFFLARIASNLSPNLVHGQNMSFQLC